MDQLHETRLDCEELKGFLAKSVRSNVRQMLATEITKLEKAISDASATHELSNNKSRTDDAADTTVPKASTEKKPVVYTTKITSYGWDQTTVAVKVYVTLAGVENVPKENVKVEFELNSFNLLVSNLNGKNHNLHLKNLLNDIVPEKCSFKVKSGTVFISLNKAESKNWDNLTQSMQKKKEAKTPKFDKDEDPSAGIMGMMKQMYEDGDDDMKRTIAKAWSESRNKPPGAGLDL